jgi:hypothetical protein
MLAVQGDWTGLDERESSGSRPCRLLMGCAAAPWLEQESRLSHVCCIEGTNCAAKTGNMALLEILSYVTMSSCEVEIFVLPMLWKLRACGREEDVESGLAL